MSKDLFTVTDPKTGLAPDLPTLSRSEHWINELMSTGFDTFAIEQNGTLLLTDGCGEYCYTPPGRFIVKFNG